MHYDHMHTPVVEEQARVLRNACESVGRLARCVSRTLLPATARNARAMDATSKRPKEETDDEQGSGRAQRSAAAGTGDHAREQRCQRSEKLTQAGSFAWFDVFISCLLSGVSRTSTVQTTFSMYELGAGSVGDGRGRGVGQGEARLRLS
jgi:hypothetical protein